MSAWFEGISPTLTIDAEGGKVPLREHAWIKESPTLDHFVDKAFKTNSEVGRRLPVTKAEKPEDAAKWRETHMPKLYDAGLLERPPTDPSLYGIKRPDDIPETLWSDENATEFGKIGVKHGLSKAAMDEMLALHRKAVGGVNEGLKTNYETAQLALKREFKDKYDERMESAKRFFPSIFKTEEEVALFDKLGIGDHPVFLGVMARLSAFAEQDKSFKSELGSTGGTGKMTLDEVRAKVRDISSNPNNPDHKGYWAKEKAVLDKIDTWYKEATGDAPPITIGASTGMRQPA